MGVFTVFGTVLLGFGCGVASAYGYRRFSRQRSSLIHLATSGATDGALETPRSTPSELIVAPDHDSRAAHIERLCEQHGTAGAVLLITSPTTHDSYRTLLANQPLVFTTETRRPTCAVIRAAATRLAQVLPVTVIVEGADALEPPEPDEPASAVLEELLEFFDRDAVIIALEGDPLPRPPDRTLDNDDKPASA